MQEGGDQLLSRGAVVQSRHGIPDDGVGKRLFPAVVLIPQADIKKEINFTRKEILCQIRRVAHPADISIPVHPAVFLGEPEFVLSKKVQQGLSVEIRRQSLPVIGGKNIFCLPSQSLGTAAFLGPQLRLPPFNPIPFDGVQGKIGLHTYNQIWYLGFGQRPVQNRSRFLLGVALRQVFCGSHSTEGEARLIKNYLVGQSGPSIAAGFLMADNEVSVSAGAPLQQSAGKLTKMRGRAWMNPSVTDKLFGETDSRCLRMPGRILAVAEEGEYL